VCVCDDYGCEFVPTLRFACVFVSVFSLLSHIHYAPFSLFCFHHVYTYTSVYIKGKNKRKFIDKRKAIKFLLVPRLHQRHHDQQQTQPQSADNTTTSDTKHNNNQNATQNQSSTTHHTSQTRPVSKFVLQQVTFNRRVYIHQHFSSYSLSLSLSLSHFHTCCFGYIATIITYNCVCVYVCMCVCVCVCI